jgi:hypothetical protein
MSEIEQKLLIAFDNLISACELPGEHCEVQDALPAAKQALKEYLTNVNNELVKIPPKHTPQALIEWAQMGRTGATQFQEGYEAARAWVLMRLQDVGIL